MSEPQAGEGVPPDDDVPGDGQADDASAAERRAAGAHVARQQASRDAFSVSITGDNNRVGTPDARDDGVSWARRGAIIGALSLVIAALTYFGITLNQPGNSPPGQIGPPSPQLAPPEVQASISFTPDRPEGCSRIYIITGNVEELPADAAAIWLVAQLYADPAQGSPNALYYPKQRIAPEADGSFRASIEANTKAGVRTGRFLLALADPEADVLMQRFADSDRAGDGRVTDGERLALPPGSREIAGSADSAQRC